MLRRTKIVLGISFGHGDSSAALIVDGKLIAAAEEERFNRIKHFAGFPTQAVHYCLKEGGVGASQIQCVAIAKKTWNQALKKMSFVLTHPGVLAQKKSKGEYNSNAFKLWLRDLGLEGARPFHCEHHFAHMMSAYYLSQSESQALLSFDGLGDFVSTAVGRSSPQGLKILDRVIFPHSLGFFYTAMTQYLGFPHFGDEFKVMGLSSLGKPRFLSQMRNLVREAEPFGFRINLEAFPIHKATRGFSVENHRPSVAPFYNASYLTAILGIPPRKSSDPLLSEHWDLAKSVQTRFEEIANHLLKYLELKTDTETLALAGGCAHNSVWVGKIPQVSRFKAIHVAPASHDAGIAVGAAIAAYEGPVSLMDDHNTWALLGPRPFEKTLAGIPDGLEEVTFKKDRKLLEFVAKELTEGKIVGLAQGRLEFGPRALGNRSILADPRRKEMKNKLNDRVKHRESFRPFAASVIMEFQDQWFENAFYAPTMEAVFQVRPNMRSKIAGVVHEDGSCRIQSVLQKSQPFYYQLIEEFRKLTGVPMLINTSFNDSEPIVLTSEDAIRCFLTTEMDYLILENRLFCKKGSALSLTA